MNFAQALRNEVKAGNITAKYSGKELNRFGYKAESLQGAVQDALAEAYLTGNGDITIEALEKAVNRIEAISGYSLTPEKLDERCRQLGTSQEIERQNSRARSSFMPWSKARANGELLQGASAAYQRLIRSLNW